MDEEWWIERYKDVITCVLVTCNFLRIITLLIKM